MCESSCCYFCEWIGECEPISDWSCYTNVIGISDCAMRGIYVVFENEGEKKIELSDNFSTHLLTVLTKGVILSLGYKKTYS